MGHEPPQRASAEGEAEAIVRNAELKATEILARAHSERESLLEEELALAERAALETKEKVQREAEAIVREAERKAGETLAGLERASRRLEQEMQEVARRKTLMAMKHKKLSEFLLAALEEIEHASANGSASVRDLGGLQEELRDTLRGTE